MFHPRPASGVRSLILSVLRVRACETLACLTARNVDERVKFSRSSRLAPPKAGQADTVASEAEPNPDTSSRIAGLRLASLACDAAADASRMNVLVLPADVPMGFKNREFSAVLDAKIGPLCGPERDSCTRCFPE